MEVINTVDETTQTVAADSVTADQTSVDQTAQTATQDASVTSKDGQTDAGTTVDQGAEPTAHKMTAEERIAQLVAKHREAETREAYWRGRAEAGTKPADQAPSGPQTPVELPFPEPPVRPMEPYVNDYQDYDEYQAAVKEHQTAKEAYAKAVREHPEKLKAYYAQEYRKSIAERERHEQVQKVQQTEAEIRQTYEKRIETAKAADPEIASIIEDKTFPISHAMAYVIRRSEAPEKLLKYLHTHRDEAQKIFDLTPMAEQADGTMAYLPTGNPIAAAIQMARIDANLTGTVQQPAPEEKKVSQAPEPHTPVGGGKGGTVILDDDKVSMEEFARRRNEKEYGKQQRR